MSEMQTLAFYRLITPKWVHDLLMFVYRVRTGRDAQEDAKGVWQN